MLKGSRITSDDKKSVIVESGAEAGGVLSISKVRAAIRLLGSGFFQEMTGAKRDKGLKTYDHTAFTVEEASEEPDHEAYWVQEELDDQTLEILAAEDDQDAAMVLQFEDAISETVQNDSEMCAYYTAYQEARKRLAEKVLFRVFWSVKKGDKGYGKKGKSKGKGKGSLANRIANSYCRICLKKGHWKNECPARNSSNASSTSSSTNVPTTFAVVEEVPEVLINMAIAEDTWINKGDNQGNMGSRWHKIGVRKGLKRVHAKWVTQLKERLRKVQIFEPAQMTPSGQQGHMPAGLPNSE